MEELTHFQDIVTFANRGLPTKAIELGLSAESIQQARDLQKKYDTLWGKAIQRADVDLINTLFEEIAQAQVEKYFTKGKK